MAKYACDCGFVCDIRDKSSIEDHEDACTIALGDNEDVVSEVSNMVRFLLPKRAEEHIANISRRLVAFDVEMNNYYEQIEVAPDDAVLTTGLSIILVDFILDMEAKMARMEQSIRLNNISASEPENEADNSVTNTSQEAKGEEK